jgi:hypothetical protein
MQRRVVGWRRELSALLLPFARPCARMNPLTLHQVRHAACQARLATSNACAWRMPPGPGVNFAALFCMQEHDLSDAFDYSADYCSVDSEHNSSARNGPSPNYGKHPNLALCLGWTARAPASAHLAWTGRGLRVLPAAVHGRSVGPTPCCGVCASGGPCAAACWLQAARAAATSTLPPAAATAVGA